MRKLIRSSFMFILVLAGFFILVSGGFLVFLTLYAYRPSPVEPLAVEGKSDDTPGEMMDFSFITWNIGYCGLGKEMDFFYDGGKSVRPAIGEYERYLNGVLNTLQQYIGVDFFLLQEVDRVAKRSYRTDQAILIDHFLKNYVYVFSKNYDAPFIPFPIFHPMGKVMAGMMTLSRQTPLEAVRYASPVNFPWPKKLFLLNRCFILTRFRVDSIKSLVVINLHHSAYEDADALRKEELSLLKNMMLREYEQGNYVIAGGDWNQNPVGFNKYFMKNEDPGKFILPQISKDFLPAGWKWVYDPELATNRDLNTPYLKGSTFTTIIDFFVVSPNVEVTDIRTVPVDFDFSDHRPVILNVHLSDDTIKN